MLKSALCLSPFGIIGCARIYIPRHEFAKVKLTISISVVCSNTIHGFTSTWPTSDRHHLTGQFQFVQFTVFVSVIRVEHICKEIQNRFGQVVDGGLAFDRSLFGGFATFTFNLCGACGLETGGGGVPGGLFSGGLFIGGSLFSGFATFTFGLFSGPFSGGLFGGFATGSRYRWSAAAT